MAISVNVKMDSEDIITAVLEFLRNRYGVTVRREHIKLQAKPTMRLPVGAAFTWEPSDVQIVCEAQPVHIKA